MSDQVVILDTFRSHRHCPLDGISLFQTREPTIIVRILRLDLDPLHFKKEFNYLLPHDPAQVCNRALVPYEPITALEVSVKDAADSLNLVDVPIYG